ncbi:hypothetical protein SNE40_015854 [Patella caerulea]|uniref:Uncharacterized protein n=1 Tax=Patella caerulea TaxID=87958 RepID=A0AAN8PFN9_PATCE
MDPRQTKEGSARERHFITRAFYQFIQCLHHLSNLEEPSTCFSKKEKELNRFIRPARSNETISEKIKDVNAAWANTMRHELCKHYEEEKYQILNTIFLNNKNLSYSEVMSAGEIAMSWAKRNYGKRLRQTVVDHFMNAELPEMTDQQFPEPAVSPPPPSLSTPGSPDRIDQPRLEPTPSPSPEPQRQLVQQSETEVSMRMDTAPPTTISPKSTTVPPVFNVIPQQSKSRMFPPQSRKTVPPSSSRQPDVRVKPINSRHKVQRRTDSNARLNTDKPTYRKPIRKTTNKDHYNI